MIMKTFEHFVYDIKQEQTSKVCEALYTEQGTFHYESLCSEYALKFITDKLELKPYLESIWSILQESYQKIGGLKTYNSFQSFVSMAKNAKLVFDENNNIIACAIYRKIENSYKCVAIGCVQDNKIGKLGLQEIIKDDITKTDLHFWGEVSGAIEHYMKKFNAYPMHKLVAYKILDVNEEEIDTNTNDDVHYKRQLGKDKEIFQKMIFGVKSQEIFEEMIEMIDNYEGFMKEVNKLNENNNAMYNVKQALFIINNIARLYEENELRELLPNWYEALLMSKETLERNNENSLYDEEIGYVDYFISTLPILQLHKIEK